MVNRIYVWGYTASLLSLLISLVLFLSFRWVIGGTAVMIFTLINVLNISHSFNQFSSMRCTRIRIHIQLFISLALSCIAWISWYNFIVESPEVIQNNSVSLNMGVHNESYETQLKESFKFSSLRSRCVSCSILSCIIWCSRITSGCFARDYIYI